MVFIMSIEILHFDGLNALPSECMAMFQAGEHDSFDLSADWFYLLESRARFPDVKPQYYIFKQGDEVHGVLPLAIRPSAIGSFTNFYSSLYRPLLKPTVTVDELAACLRNIATDTRISVFRFDAMDIAHPTFDLLEAALRRAGFWPFRFFGFGNWYLPTRWDSFEEYFQGLPPLLRNTVRRREKKFLADGRGELRIVTGGNTLEDAIVIWDKIYRASWKKPEPFPEFVPSLIRMCAEKGWLRLGLAYYDGEAVAAQFWIVSYGRASIYKLAYDINFARFSVGTLLTANLMRHVLEVDKVCEVDYLTGDDGYKKDWMSNRRERWGLLAFNPRTFFGLLGAANEYVRRMLKRVVLRMRFMHIRDR